MLSRCPTVSASVSTLAVSVLALMLAVVLSLSMGFGVWCGCFAVCCDAACVGISVHAASVSALTFLPSPYTLSLWLLLSFPFLISAFLLATVFLMLLLPCF